MSISCNFKLKQKKQKYPASFWNSKDNPIFFKNNDAAFTITEVVVSVGIVIVLLGVSIFSFSSFRDSANLNNAVSGVKNVLKQARSDTLASKNGLNYGTHFETDRYVLFGGSAYDPASQNNQIFYLPSSVEIFNININGGGQNIIFNKISGSANGGSVGLRIAGNQRLSKQINIDLSGNAAVLGQDALVPFGMRIFDGRHIHFDLGWSIQGASTLTFVFSDPPNPDSVENISMSSYFGGGQTNFDYQGTFTAFSENQTLRVHTHFLDASNTILSVSRNGMENTKAVSISIDGKQIVLYDASGSASVGAFGGVMEIQ